MSPPVLTRTEAALEVSLSDCKGSAFQDALEKVKMIPGRRWDSGSKVWLLPADAKTAERVLSTMQPTADPEIREWIRQSRTEEEADLVTRVADDCDSLLVPWAYDRTDYQPEEVNGEPFKGLKAHQRAVVGAVANPDEVRVVIADDMGLGKTGTALTVVAESELQREDCVEDLVMAGPKLVVCPNSVKGVWKREIARWLGPDTPCQVVDGSSPKARNQQLVDAIAENAWIIVNYEQLRTQKIKKQLRNGGHKMVEVMKEPLFGSTEWVAVIADEVHRAKNRKAAQTRGLYKITAPIMIGLSGTPLMNSPDDLWSILHWLFPKEYTSYWRFYEQYVDYVEGYFGKDIVGVKNADALRFELHKRLYRRTKDQVLDLPEKQRIFVPVELDEKARKLYNDAERGLWFELETAVEEGDADATRFVEAAQKSQIYSIPNGAARTVRLRQILSTPAVLGGEDHSPKMDALVESILDNKHKQHVVFSEFVASCETLQARLEKHGLSVETYTGETKESERSGIEDSFQRGEIDVLIGTIGAMREGITLTAADTVHFLERAWVPAWNHQAEDRLHRIGQSNAVTVYIYQAENTVDDGTIHLTNKLKDKIVRTVLPQDTVKES